MQAVRVRVSVRVCVRVPVGVCADGAGNARAGRAGGRCVFVPGVGVICAFLLCVRV